MCKVKSYPPVTSNKSLIHSFSHLRQLVPNLLHPGEHPPPVGVGQQLPLPPLRQPPVPPAQRQPLLLDLHDHGPGHGTVFGRVGAR